MYQLSDSFARHELERSAQILLCVRKFLTQLAKIVHEYSVCMLAGLDLGSSVNQRLLHNRPKIKRGLLREIAQPAWRLRAMFLWDFDHCVSLRS
jgi:hypothetical protein